ncbi:putative serine/threonine protein kinase [Aspergillus melleus]|uniref:putative serine/threonine protein kinase n=1 Tax=Aspergillus melleus TaxID=138277 RepID=UPI001E8D09B8|nr:Ark- serine/threonine protein kinase [Aspergillus melleus]KAH8422756.1 Ark- serine/threonine protein kinase [Aspergillus melleus]
MLKENPQKRPNIYEVLRESCHMQGKDVPIRDIYATRSTSEARRYQELPPSPTDAPQVGAVISPPIQETQTNIPEIAPMRRGRPTRPTTTSQHNSAKPSPSPFRGGPSSADPFAVLDSGTGHKSRNSTDEFTNRFPSLDHFNILHEKGGKFDFEPNAADAQQEDEDLARRLTNALADDAFVKRPASEKELPEPPVQRRPQPSPLKTRPTESFKEEPIRPQVPLHQPVPQKPTMVSTGTMTSPPSTPGLSETKRPIYKFPSSDHQRRPSSQPWSGDNEQRLHRPSKAPSPSRSSSNLAPNPRVSADRISDLSSSSSRPSLEGLRPTNLDVEDPVGRSKSANGKSRPVSMHAGTKFESGRGSESARSSLDLPRPSYEMGVPLQHARTEVDQNFDRANISSDIDYLRAREEESNRKREKRYSGSSKHTKRSSLSTLSLSGTKNRFAGRFGEAFRRFEQTNSDSKPQSPATEESPKPFMSVTASELVEPPAEISDGENNDISPEMRRELERRRLSQEEKRVANAAAEYRRQVAEGGGRGDTPRSLAIQGRVKNLLAEGNKPAPPPKTATGYGRYTDESTSALQAKQAEARPEPRLNTRNVGPAAYGSPQTQPSPGADRWEVPSNLPRQETARTGAARPAAPPKPKNLRALGQEGVGGGDDRSPIMQEAPATPGEDWEANFSRRYPSLSGLEMVETEIEAPKFPSLRTREV